MNHELVRHGVAARYSEAAVFQGVVYLAGMVPERGDTVRTTLERARVPSLTAWPFSHRSSGGRGQCRGQC